MDTPTAALFHSFPEALFWVSQGHVIACNALAQHYIPQLTPGAPAPAWLPSESGDTSGTFTLGTSTFRFSANSGPEGQAVLFRPAEQSVFTDAQISGVLRQIRQFMSEFMLALSSDGQPDNAYQSFYRMFRLLDNLEYLQRSKTEPPPTPPFPSLDLADLCRQIVQQASPLLAETDLWLEFSSSVDFFLIPGIPALLQRMLLELIANSARAVEQGRISLRLCRQNEHALLCLSDSGRPLMPRQIAAMLQQDNGSLPDPKAGAGLGLEIVRHIVSLHQGTFLFHWDGESPTAVVALPTKPLSSHYTVRTSRTQDSGLSPLLVALADVLPAHLFREAGLD